MLLKLPPFILVANFITASGKAAQLMHSITPCIHSGQEMEWFRATIRYGKVLLRALDSDYNWEEV